MGRVGRRRLVKMSAALASGLALGGPALAPLVAEAAPSGYGPLAAKKAQNEPAGPAYLALPTGFEYAVFSKGGEPLSGSAQLTPGGHDGMGAFALPNGNIRLIRNHELGTVSASRPLLGDPAKAYDPKAAGGTTSLEWNPATRQVVKSFVSLSGTVRNCAGGVTPWGSWLTCEESTVVAGSTYDKTHGYVFEVPAAAEGQVQATPLPIGRTAWEAAVVDPRNRHIYLTEDTGNAGFYRYIPGGNWQATGTLQMLAVRGPNATAFQFDTRNFPDSPYPNSPVVKVGETLGCNWVTIPDPSNPSGNLWQQGWERGGALFNRLEGAWFADGRVYFDSTGGGVAREGQIWAFDPRGNTLTLIYESPAEAELDNPDNLTVSPRGGLVICEDGSRDNLYVRGLYRDGTAWKIFPFVQNVINDAEFAGACYSPDGRYLFVNIQSPGYTFAIWGPWQSGAL